MQSLSIPVKLRAELTDAMLDYMREHSDIDACKHKLTNILNDWCTGYIPVIDKFEIKYSESNLATIYLWDIPAVFPAYIISLDLNVKSEDIPE